MIQQHVSHEVEEQNGFELLLPLYTAAHGRRTEMMRRSLLTAQPMLVRQRTHRRLPLYRLLA